MATRFISLGLALLVTLQVATEDPDHETSVRHSRETTTAAAETSGDVQGGDRDSSRPGRLIPGRQSADERPTLGPRRARRTAAEEEPRVEESAPQPRPTPRVAQGDRETVVVRLDHVPAADIAETISNWLELERQATGQLMATIVPVVITNDLVVSGSPQQLDTIRAVVAKLDRPTPQLHVKGMLVVLTPSETPTFVPGQTSADVSDQDFGEIIARLQERGDVQVLAQPELLCSENQPALLRIGSRVPRVTGAAGNPRGPTASRVTLEELSVGTMLGVTARVTEDDSVALEIDLERSQLGPEHEGTALATSGEGSVGRSRQVQTLTVQTTVSLRSGQTAVLGGLVQQTEQGWGELLLLLQPTILR